jgi:hypothetical protein
VKRNSFGRRYSWRPLIRSPMKNPTAVSQFVYVRTHAVTKVLEGLIWNCVLVVLIIEAFYAIPLRFPSLLKYAPNAIVNEIRRVYDHEDRNIIQFYKPCAQYDPYVTYTLRPGHCVFANREFSTDMLINRLGTRDTEDASVKPEIVVLGDSFTMGWGVKQDETFAKVLEKMVGMKVLNAGISSYDTVREMRLFHRLDTSNVKYLILQYCDNDYAENVKFHKDQNYNIMSRQLYDHIVNRVASKYENYTFGSYTRQALVRIRDRLAELGKNGLKTFAGKSYKRNYNEEVESFLYVLTHARKKDLAKLTLIVFEANVPIYRHDDGFIKLLNERIKDGAGKNLPKKIITQNFLKDLRDEDYYILDEHLKPKAHLFIASRLAATILKEERTN